jgi:hypothetical protein
MMSHPQASALRRFVWPKSLVLLLGFLLPSAYAIDTPLRDLSNPGRQTISSAPSTGQAAYSIPPTVPESEKVRFWQAPLHLVNGLDQCKTQEVYAKELCKDGPSFRHLLDRPVTTTPSSAK